MYMKCEIFLEVSEPDMTYLLWTGVFSLGSHVAILMNDTYVTGFAKTRHHSARTGIQFYA